MNPSSKLPIWYALGETLSSNEAVFVGAHKQADSAHDNEQRLMRNLVFPRLNLHTDRLRRKPDGHVHTDLSTAHGASCPILRFGENARPINQDPKNWNHTEQQRTCFVVSGRSTSSFTRQSKEGPNFSVAQLFRQLSKRLSVYISALAKCRKAFQKSRYPPGIPKLNGISKVL